MQVAISGQHISVGNSLQEYVKDRATEVVQRYFEQAISTNVHFSKQGFEFICDIVVNEGSGRHVLIRSNAHCNEVYSSFDMALARLEKQLRKYKSKLKDRHNRIKVSEAMPATKYIINPNIDSDEENMSGDNPVIIAEKATQIMPLSVNEAVMQMDLENLPALMFQNSKTGRINIVYYRKDGNISWVDSKN